MVAEGMKPVLNAFALVKRAAAKKSFMIFLFEIFYDKKTYTKKICEKKLFLQECESSIY